MKILVDLTTLADNFSGIERFASRITYELIKNKNIEFILLFKDHIDDYFKEIIEKQNNIQTVIIERRNKLVFNQIVLPAVIRKINADWYLFPAFPVPWLCFKKNVISAIHDLCCFDCPQTMRLHQRHYFKLSYFLAAKKSKKIVTVSKFSASRINKLLQQKKEDIWIIYNGIEEKFYHIKNTKKENYILSLCTLEPRKNIKLLIEAYNELVLEKNFRIPLILVGRTGWKTGNLLKNIDERTKKQMIFMGFVEDEKLFDIYSKAKLFVFTSIYEGFGITPLEAMACRTRVLSSNVTAMPEILGDYVEYFESNNKEDLKCKILELLIENVDTKTIEEARSYSKQYNWKNEANKLLNLIIEEENR